MGRFLIVGFRCTRYYSAFPGFLGGTATGSAMGLIVIPASELVGFPHEAK